MEHLEGEVFSFYLKQFHFHYETKVFPSSPLPENLAWKLAHIHVHVCS